MTRKTLPWILAAVCAACVLSPRTARADGPGLRLGITDDPDTFFLGFQYEILLTANRSIAIEFRPGIDVGFDDDIDLFTIRGTGHFNFKFPVGRRGQTYLYPLFGPAIYYTNYDCPDTLDCDNAEFGIDAGFGFQIDRFSFELWLGLPDEDLPDITFSFAIRF